MSFLTKYFGIRFVRSVEIIRCSGQKIVDRQYLNNNRSRLSWIVSLIPQEERILAWFSKSKRYEIKKGLTEWIIYELVDVTLSAKKDYIQFYNKFAVSRWLEKINCFFLLFISQKIILSRAVDESTWTVLVCHLYIPDHSLKTIFLWESSSIKWGHPEFKQKCAYANNWLHYFDMISFKKQWFDFYDFGWIIFDNRKTLETTNPVAKFKLWFNPTIVVYINKIKFWIFFQKIHNSLIKR